MHGRQPRFQIDNLVARKMTLGLDYDSYRHFLGSTLLETQKIILENIAKAQEKQKKYYDQKTKAKDFSIGDLVALQVNPKFKIDRKYVGPFKILALPIPNVADIVRVDDNEMTIRVSLSRLKFWFESKMRENPTAQ